jgi:hypothetical protein
MNKFCRVPYSDEYIPQGSIPKRSSYAGLVHCRRNYSEPYMYIAAQILQALVHFITNY